METDKNKIELADGQEKAKKTEPVIKADAKELNSNKIKSKKGATYSDSINDNSKAPKRGKDTQQKDLVGKLQPHTIPPKKNRNFPVKMAMGLFIIFLGMIVYFLIRERQQDLEQFKKQLSFLNNQIRILQSAPKELDDFIKNQGDLNSRLQKLELNVKKLAITAKFLSNESKVSPTSAKTLESLKPKTPQSQAGRETRTKSYVTDGIPRIKNKIPEIQKTNSDSSPENQINTEEKTFTIPAIGDENFGSNNGKSNQEITKKFPPENELDSLEKKPTIVAVNEKTLKPEVKKTFGNKMTGVEKNPTDLQINEEVKQIVPTQSLKEKAREREEGHDKNLIEIATGPELIQQENFSSSNPKQSSQTNSNGLNVAKNLSPEGKQYIEFVEDMASNFFQLAKKGLKVFYEFLHRLTK